MNENPVITDYYTLPPDEESGGYPKNLSEIVFPFSEKYVRNGVFQGWNKYFRKNESAYLYIFDEDTLKRYSWDSIRTQNKFLKRFDLTYQDLKRMKWHLVYSER